MKPVITAVGNLTKKPELEFTEKNNTPVVRFTVACNGWNDDVTFLWCIAYAKNAENISKFFDKGSAIAIVGELSQYADKNKQTHSYCDVRSWDFVNGSPRRENPPPVKDFKVKGSEDGAQDNKDPF